MKSFTRLLSFLCVLGCLASIARAHPGHDDPELTWDFGHLVAHPGATLLCLGILGAGAYLAYRLARWARETPDRQG